MYIEDSDATLIVARAALEWQHERLVVVGRRAEAVVDALRASAAAARWRGPARQAFDGALDALRSKADRAVDAVDAARRATVIALREVENRVG